MQQLLAKSTFRPLAAIAPSLPVVLNQLFNSAANFVVTIALVRMLGLAEFGQFTLYYVVALSTTYMFMALVVLPAVSIAASEHDQERRQILSTAGALLIGGIAAACVLICAAQLALLAAGIDVHMRLLPFAALLAAMALNDLARRLLLFLGRVGTAWVLDLLRFAALAVALAWGAGHEGPDPVTFTMLQIAVTYAIALFGLAAVSASALRSVTLTNFRAHTRRLLGTGKWLSTSALLQMVGDNAFLIAGSALVGAEAVGIVRACETIVGVINPLIFALEHIFPRRIGQLALKLGWTQALRDYARLATAAGGGITLAIAATAILAQPLLSLIVGPAAAPYAWVLQGLCLAKLPYLVSILLAFPLRAVERTGVVATSVTVASFLAIAIAFPIIGHFDIAGMIAGPAIANLVCALLLAMQYGRIRRREFRQ